MKGYKAFDENLKCRNFQYEVGKTYKREGKIDILGHGTNCSNGFGSGIAGQIAKKYPISKKLFHVAHKENIDTLGSALFCKTNRGKYIANLYTQQTCGYNGEKYVSYDAIEKCLIGLKSYAENNNLKIGIPKIGCGLGGGNWNVIHEIIKDVFQDYDVYVYSLEG